jgi:response regulator RpfG family c-di-GMP phosphodiesterase
VEVSLAPLLELAEETDPDLAAHMDRTARLARRFGLHLDLSRALLDQVVRTARVHDIGRLAVQDPVDGHFLVGQKILARKPALISISLLVRSLNERWDGTGGPSRLRGSAIPLPSRIVAVCDAFDTLTNPLNGTEPLSTTAAMLDIVDRAGSQFDPGVVEPFRDLVTDLELSAAN